MNLKYYIENNVDLQTINIKIAEQILILFSRELFGFFYDFFFVINCRSPPSVNFKNFEIDWRKEFGKDTSTK